MSEKKPPEACLRAVARDAEKYFYDEMQENQAAPEKDLLLGRKMKPDQRPGVQPDQNDPDQRLLGEGFQWKKCRNTGNSQWHCQDQD